MITMSRKHIIPHLNYIIVDKTNWCTYVKAILVETHFQQAWVNQSMDNRQFAMLNDSLHRSYMVECIGNIHDSTAYPKLLTYKLFKEEFKFENYHSSTKQILTIH